MDAFLGKLTQHAVNYAIRSGITITAGYAIGQCSRLLKTVDGSTQRDELMTLQERLDTKIKIISPAIDLIELISARGNTTLESAVSLTKRIRWEIQSLGQRLARAAETEEASLKAGRSSKVQPTHELDIKRIISDMRRLLLRIEDAVPLINLAITTSGAGLTTQLPPSVSPSRLLQASRFLGEGDYRYAQNPGLPAQIGPSFVLSLYMLFSAHNRKQTVNSEDGPRQSTWKEVLHKCHVRIVRVPIPDTASVSEDMRLIRDEDRAARTDYRVTEYAYEFEMIEDLDDDRVHTSEDGIAPVGIRESFPVHQVSRIFYADTGKILNIGTDSESNSPVLLLKRDVSALPPRRMMNSNEQEDMMYQTNAVSLHESSADGSTTSEDVDSQDDIDAQLRQESTSPNPRPDRGAEQSAKSHFPPTLDPEWLALEVYTAEEDDLSESDDDEAGVDAVAIGIIDDNGLSISEPVDGHSSDELDDKLNKKLDDLSISSPADDHSYTQQIQYAQEEQQKIQDVPMYGVAKNSLSLLEVLLRLTVLQQFQQQNHLEIPDELLTFFLQESSTTGMDGQQRRTMRREARNKVGFDPYDESPIKRHGEEYQRGGHGNYDRQYSRSKTPFSRSTTPNSRSFDDTGSLRGQAPLQHKTPDRKPSRLNSPKSYATVASRYPSLNVYQASPLAEKRVPKVFDTLIKSRSQGTVDNDIDVLSQLNVKHELESKEDVNAEDSAEN